MHVYLKGQCPEILDPFLKEKNSTWNANEQAKVVS